MVVSGLLDCSGQINHSGQADNSGQTNAGQAYSSDDGSRRGGMSANTSQSQSIQHCSPSDFLSLWVNMQPTYNYPSDWLSRDKSFIKLILFSDLLILLLLSSFCSLFPFLPSSLSQFY